MISLCNIPQVTQLVEAMCQISMSAKSHPVPHMSGFFLNFCPRQLGRCSSESFGARLELLIILSLNLLRFCTCLWAPQLGKDAAPCLMGRGSRGWTEKQVIVCWESRSDSDLIHIYWAPTTTCQVWFQQKLLSSYFWPMISIPTKLQMLWPTNQAQALLFCAWWRLFVSLFWHPTYFWFNSGVCRWLWPIRGSSRIPSVWIPVLPTIGSGLE